MTEQLIEAGILLSVGMSVVFAFLTLLIGGIHSIAWFARIFPDDFNTSSKGAAKYHETAPSDTSSQAAIPENITAAITAAIHTHRREKN